MTVLRGASIRCWRIIEMNGAMPVPVETKRWVRSSSGSSTNLPLGPIIRIRWPIGSRHSSGREAHDRHEPHVELVAAVAGLAGADATEYGRWTILPSAYTPMVMYWPGLEVDVGSPSNFTQK
jgi:hypothetical protein